MTSAASARAIPATRENPPEARICGPGLRLLLCALRELRRGERRREEGVVGVADDERAIQQADRSRLGEIARRIADGVLLCREQSHLLVRRGHELAAEAVVHDI